MNKPIFLLAVVAALLAVVVNTAMADGEYQSKGYSVDGRYVYYDGQPIPVDKNGKMKVGGALPVNGTVKDHGRFRRGNGGGSGGILGGGGGGSSGAGMGGGTGGSILFIGMVGMVVAVMGGN